MRIDYITRDKALKMICDHCENKNCLPNFPCSLYIAFQCVDADKTETKNNFNIGDKVVLIPYDELYEMYKNDDIYDIGVTDKTILGVPKNTYKKMESEIYIVDAIDIIDNGVYHREDIYLKSENGINNDFIFDVAMLKKVTNKEKRESK